MSDDVRQQAGQPFVTTITVRFGDCDPAGIVFYPRYVEMINNLVEDWCAQGLGHSFRRLHMEQHLGLPTVNINCDFVATSTLGESLSAELGVLEIGNSSITLAARLIGADGKDRVRAKIVSVVMDLQAKRAVRIPQAMRERMTPFIVAIVADAGK
jgi:4-hydroxybenzoyl-CoA thioesterase